MITLPPESDTPESDPPEFELLESEPTDQQFQTVDSQPGQFGEQLGQYLKQSVFPTRPWVPAPDEAVVQAVLCNENKPAACSELRP